MSKLVEDSGIEPLTSECKSGALPAELIPHENGGPRTTRTSDLTCYQGCSNHLSYRPLAYETLLLKKRNEDGHINLVLTKRNILVILRKEVIQPRVPLRLPCYDTPVADRTVVKVLIFALRCNQLPWCDGRCTDQDVFTRRLIRVTSNSASCTRVTSTIRTETHF